MRYLLLSILLLAAFSLLPRTSYALSYDLIAPTNTLTRGQNVDFTIQIDTEGTSVTNATVGMTYDTQYLQYVSTTPGNAMPQVVASPTDAGKLVFSGTNTQGFNGADSFATVTFKLIAQAAGSTELCTLYAVNTTPVPTNVTPTVPIPTQLPVTGSTSNALLPILAFFGLASIGGGYVFLYDRKPIAKIKKGPPARH